MCIKKKTFHKVRQIFSIVILFLFKSFSFNSERLPQYKRESDKKSKLLFLHYSATKGVWDWLILILTTYIAIMVPYNVAFRRNDRKRDLIIFDMVIELFFIMDIVVHFRTSFVDISGRIIYDQKKIAIHYLKGWFILDFLAALPFEALYFVNHTWVSIYAIAIKFPYCIALNYSRTLS